MRDRLAEALSAQRANMALMGVFAALAVLLASDEASYMTGTELNIDGGLLAGSAATPKRD